MQSLCILDLSKKLDMKKPFSILAVVCGFFMVGLFVSPVFAYDFLQVTSTATFKPPSPVPTVINKVCPVGTPAGWGTYTPSPLWALECSSCASITTPTVTASPSAVPTWDGTGTPVPTATITNTPTVTPTVAPICNPLYPTPTVLPQSTVVPQTVVNNTALTYSAGWTLGTYSGMYQNDNHQSNVVGSYYTYDFVGNSIAIYGWRHTSGGTAQVYIDNVLHGTYSANGTFVINFLHYTASGFGYGSHTLKVVHASGAYIGVDKLIYTGLSITPTPISGSFTWLSGGTPSGFNGTYGKIVYSGGPPAAGTGLLFTVNFSPNAARQITYKIVATNHEVTANGGNTANMFVGVAGVNVGNMVSVSGTDVTSYGNYYGYLTVTAGNMSVSFDTPSDWPNSGQTDISIELWSYPTCDLVPFGTATPAPYFDTGYCASVAPVSDDFGFDLFVPDGALNCSLGWDAVTLGENVFPAVQICFQPSIFGVIFLFGEDYEIGFLALGVAAAFIYRFVRTV